MLSTNAYQNVKLTAVKNQRSEKCLFTRVCSCSNSINTS